MGHASGPVTKVTLTFSPTSPKLYVTPSRAET